MYHVRTTNKNRNISFLYVWCDVLQSQMHALFRRGQFGFDKNCDDGGSGDHGSNQKVNLHPYFWNHLERSFSHCTVFIKHVLHLCSYSGGLSDGKSMLVGSAWSLVSFNASNRSCCSRRLKCVYSCQSSFLRVVYWCSCYCHCHWRQIWNNHILTFQWVPEVTVQRCDDRLLISNPAHSVPCLVCSPPARW
jgi:hypothetical protein